MVITQKLTRQGKSHMQILNLLERLSLTLTVCAAHSSADCFVNLSQCNADLTKSMLSEKWCYTTIFNMSISVVINFSYKEVI